MTDYDDPDDKNKKDQQVETAKAIINRYRNTYKYINPDVLLNLSDLKEITLQPKQTEPDKATQEIQTLLGAAESGETLRQERWQGKVKCPYCNSRHIKRLPIEEQKSKDIYTYRCLDCNETFDDDSETKIEAGVPPLNTWMLCWFLLGCTNSVQYIAAKLGLSVATVELMVRHMQRIFKTNEPLKHILSFEEWNLSHGKGYKTAMKEALDKQIERFRGFSIGKEMDTAEVRKQKSKAKPKPL